MKFTKIPTETFKQIQLNAGMMLKAFVPGTGTVNNSDILGATSGGISFEAVLSTKDFGEDIDNCPKNTKELKKGEQWEIKATGTMVTITADSAAKLATAADIDSSDNTHIVPRNDIDVDKDFDDLWIVADYSEYNGETNGGYVAIHMMNNLSTGGFKLQTADKEKGKMSFEFTAHYSLSEQDKVPFEIYIKQGTAEA